MRSARPFSTAGDWKAAQADFQKAVDLDPAFAQAHANLGLALLQNAQPDAAAGHLDRAIKIFGNTPDAAHPHYLRAKIYTERNEIEKAAAELQQAVALRPDFAEAWSDLGEARKNLLDDDGAFAAYQRSWSSKPEMPSPSTAWAPSICGAAIRPLPPVICANRTA